MRRKLAAVLCADVVGYSRLMEQDEAAALNRVKAAFAAFEPALTQHHGRVVKLMGDGALIEFDSAVDAVACAVVLQQAVASSDPDLRFRIGVNLGDVIVDGDDLYGDGVNIAARLQTYAPPGGIALAQTVREHITGKLSLALKDMGSVTMKNISRPIQVFTVIGPAPQGAARDGERVAICVLPFENMSGDREQDFFAAGVSEDVIIDLSKIAALQVIATKSPGDGETPRRMGQALGAAYVLKGSVRRSGHSIRLGAQLIDVASETTIWAERYDREIKDVLALQADLSRSVAQALKLRLEPNETKAFDCRPETIPEAYRLLLLAREYSVTGSERHKALTQRLCQRVVELEPDNARAWALLGATLVQRRRTQGTTDTGAFEINRALALAPDLSAAHAANAMLCIDQGRYDDGATAALEALRLDPDGYEALLASGQCAIMLRDYASAISHFERAAALFPNEYLASALVIQCYQGQSNDDAALDACRRARLRIERIVAVEPDHSAAIGHGAGILALLGERELAREWASRASLLEPDNVNLQMNLACAWAASGDADSALDVLERFAPLIGRELFRWMENDNDLDSLRALPRFQRIMTAVRESLTP